MARRLVESEIDANSRQEIQRSRSMRILMLSILLVLGPSGTSGAEPREQLFDDPIFRRCVNWMLDGQRGALIQDLCLDEYEIPPPSLFLCARKVQTGFLSSIDREGCAIIFEEQAKKVESMAGTTNASHRWMGIFKQYLIQTSKQPIVSRSVEELYFVPTPEALPFAGPRPTFRYLPLASRKSRC